MIADGVAGPGAAKHGGKPGPAYAGIKVWASSPDEAIETGRPVLELAGFTMKGKIDVYETAPSEPARARRAARLRNHLHVLCRCQKKIAPTSAR